MAVASVPLGDLTSEQMRVIGELARAYGDGAIRVTADQDLLFRWVNSCDVRQLYRRLAAAGLGLAEAGTIADVTSCPGAETCRLAVTQSRGLGRLLEDHLRARPDLIAAADGARIKISGCPNGCGLHHIATIGFQGSVRRLGSRAVPQYFVMVGGGAHDRGAIVRPARREDSRAPRPAGGRTADRSLRRRPPAGRDRDGLLRAGRARHGQAPARRPRDAAAGRRGAGRLHRSRRGRRVRAGGHGRGVLCVIDVCGCIDLHFVADPWYSPRVEQLKDALHQEWLRDRPCDATATTRRLGRGSGANSRPAPRGGR